MENKAIGIVVPNDFVKRLPFGGASGFIQNVVAAIASPTVIFGAGANGTPLWSPQKLESGATFIGTYPFRFPSPLPLRLRAFWGYLRNRRRILSSGVRLIYVHSPECALPFLFGRQRLPVVFHQHGSGNPVATAKFSWARNGLLVRLFDKIHQIIYERADWIIAIDRLCLEQAQSHGAGHKVSLLMNAVDRHQFRPDRAARNSYRAANGYPEDEFVLLFVGRIEEIKQLDRLIAGLSLLKTNRRVRLLIAGEGTRRPMLERMVRELSLEGSVQFLGKISHDRLPAYYNMADALALPSKMEGVPMVILEALACGTPVIASAVGGIPDLVSTGINGVLLGRTSPDAIAAAIFETASAPWDRDTVSATVARWGAVEVGAELSAIFDRIIEHRGQK